jgi:hypothetical protein
LEKRVNSGVRQTSHIDDDPCGGVGRESCGYAAQVIALECEVESDNCSWPYLDSEGQRAVTKDAVGERRLHLFAPARAASHLCAVLLEQQERGVALRGAARRWHVEGALPAAADVLRRLGVRCDYVEEKKEGQ